MIRNISALVVVLLLATDTTAWSGNEIVSATGGDEQAVQRRTTTRPPVVAENYEYYEVCGCCEKDIQNDLKKKCVKWADGKKYDAVTKWKMKWDYGHSRGSGGCAVDAFTVTVNVMYYLPKWMRPEDAPPSLKEKWDTYVQKLMVHEKGHRDRAVEAAEELTRAVSGLSLVRTCEELDRSVYALSRTRADKLLEEQKTYDAATNHGVAQGAVFP